MLKSYCDLPQREIAYIVDQDQNVGLNRPLRSGFHWNDLYLWIRNREPVKDHVD